MYRHYVYVHRRADDARVFYVGKGQAERAHDRDNRNRYWRAVVAKHGIVVELVAWFDVEVDAHQCECDLIAWYGRRNLTNLTDGGEGTTGRKRSPEEIDHWRESWRRNGPFPHPRGMLGKKHIDESRAAISAAASGQNNPMFGATHSDEVRSKISSAVRANHARSKTVIDTATGEKFISARECARQRALNPNTLKARLSGRQSNQTTLRYE